MLTGEIKAQEINAVHRLAQKLGLCTKNRSRHLVYQRYYLMAYLHDVVGISKSQIGVILGRDHTSVIHGYNVYQNYKNDAYYLRLTTEVRQAFPMNKFSNEIIDSPMILELALSSENYRAIQVHKLTNGIETDDKAINDVLSKYFGG